MRAAFPRQALLMKDRYGKILVPEDVEFATFAGFNWSTLGSAGYLLLC